MDAKEDIYRDQLLTKMKNFGVDEYGCRTRIYHLPMDQQYDKVKIKTSEECYAYTVQEAEAKGFRRAYRWYGNGY